MRSLRISSVSVFALGLASVLAGGSLVYAQQTKQDTQMGWRINQTASAWATMTDGTKRLRITLTGSGTFSPWEPNDVTGDGHYEIADQSGQVIDSGDFVVLGLVSYKQSPGGSTIPAGTNLPLLPNAIETRGGLALLRVQFSDGALGTLTISCNLSSGASGQSPEMFEGVIASKGYVMYGTPEPGGTLFALLGN